MREIFRQRSTLSAAYEFSDAGYYGKGMSSGVGIHSDYIIVFFATVRFFGTIESMTAPYVRVVVNWLLVPLKNPAKG